MIREILQTVESYFGEIFGNDRAVKNSVILKDKQLSSKKRTAFTLAEVLITLGIIGVVAALTMPTLIANNKKQTYVTALKKAYSTLQNAYRMMLVNEDVTEYSDTYCGGDSEDPNNYNLFASTCFENILKNFNVVDKFVTPTLGACSKSWCSYTQEQLNLFDGFPQSSFITADGIVYMFTCGIGNLYVDINGANKAPNQIGRDIFRFHVGSSTRTNNLVVPYGSISFQWDAAQNSYVAISSEEWKECLSTNLIPACTAKVIIEGKMDY